MAFRENGVPITLSRVGGVTHRTESVGLGKVFLFCAVVTGVTPPWSIQALYAPTACLVLIRSGAHTTGEHQSKQWPTSSTHTNSHIISSINGPYATRYTAIISVIHKKSQTMSNLQKSCISGNSQRNITIYRKIANFSFRRLRKRIVLRSLAQCYPQTINNTLYFYTIFVQDMRFNLHYELLLYYIIIHRLYKLLYTYSSICLVQSPHFDAVLLILNSFEYVQTNIHSDF